jgi:hypothetical protein
MSRPHTEIVTPLYSIGTWDMDAQAYTPQVGTSRTFNMTAADLRRAIHELRGMGYRAHRFRDANGSHDDNDWCVLIERTDGKPEAQILEDWKR